MCLVLGKGVVGDLSSDNEHNKRPCPDNKGHMVGMSKEHRGLVPQGELWCPCGLRTFKNHDAYRSTVL